MNTIVKATIVHAPHRSFEPKIRMASGGMMRIKKRLKHSHTNFTDDQDRKAESDKTAIKGKVSAGAGTQPGTITS